jgi:uncharacterized membrane protein YbaN (DUF454 family)
MLTISGPPTDAPQDLEDFGDLAPARELRVIHSSFGRLRVHLPHWSGAHAEQIADELRQLRDVTHAEANPLTGNVLLLFDPQQTTAQSLIDRLPALRLDPFLDIPLLEGEGDNPLALAEEFSRDLAVADPPDLVAHAAAPGTYVTGIRRTIYKALGWASVGMAVVGAILPGIPTVPFVVLAGYFFVRSSPEAHAWLRQSRLFGALLRDWEEHRGVRRSVRNVAAGLIGASMVLVLLLELPLPLLATILPLQLLGLVIVLRLRVIDPALSAPAAAAV